MYCVQSTEYPASLFNHAGRTPGTCGALFPRSTDPLLHSLLHCSGLLLPLPLLLPLVASNRTSTRGRSSLHGSPRPSSDSPARRSRLGSSVASPFGSLRFHPQSRFFFLPFGDSVGWTGRPLCDLHLSVPSSWISLFLPLSSRIGARMTLLATAAGTAPPPGPRDGRTRCGCQVQSVHVVYPLRPHGCH